MTLSTKCSKALKSRKTTVATGIVASYVITELECRVDNQSLIADAM